MDKFEYAARELLEHIDELGGIGAFTERMTEHPEKELIDVVHVVHSAIAEYECDTL